jgi:acetyltransferase
VDPVPLSDATLETLDAFLPAHWSRANPVDIIGDASPERFRRTVEVLMQAPETQGLLVMMAPLAMWNAEQIARALVDVLQSKRKPAFAVWMGGSEMDRGKAVFNEAGIPTFDTPERAVRAFMNLYEHGRDVEILQQIPPRLRVDMRFDTDTAHRILQEGLARKHDLLTETEAKALLDAYGIPVNPTQSAGTAQEAVRIAEDFGYPVVMKIDSRDIPHKSDVDGVVLNIGDAGQVETAFAAVMQRAAARKPGARIDGVTIQPMLKRPDFEIILGIKKDRDFGPVILFGMGGIMTEILKDRAIELPPLSHLLARRLMEATRVHRLLAGYRNLPRADLEALEEVLIRLGQLATDFSDIEELDINPLIVDGRKIVAVDARALVGPASESAPHHLVISPYPGQYETHVKTEGDCSIFIRPIRPEDASLMVDLFNTLSPTTVYFRFFSPLKALPHHMLARFTQIDYDREVGLVALDDTGVSGKMLGVARVMLEANQRNAEFSVLVADDWQRQGIGADLLKRCLDIAKERSIERVWGMVLPENTGMLALGKRLGFARKRNPEENVIELSIDLERLTQD